MGLRGALSLRKRAVPPRKVLYVAAIVAWLVVGLMWGVPRYYHAARYVRLDQWWPDPEIQGEAIALGYEKTIMVRPGSIFYSFYVNGTTLVGYGREHHDGNTVIQVWADRLFRIFRETERKEDEIQAEDPRIFRHNGTLYVMNNCLFTKSKLYNTDTKTFTPIKKDGKNFSMISHKGRLYFIYLMRPFEMYELDPATGDVTPVAVNQTGLAGELDDTWRGGTPGYWFGPRRPDAYYGFGHRTYQSAEGKLTHDPYFWTVDFAKYELPTLEITKVAKPECGSNIFDPTSVVVIEGIPYLVTAESQLNWFHEQPYDNKIYRIRVGEGGGPRSAALG